MKAKATLYRPGQEPEVLMQRELNPLPADPKWAAEWCVPATALDVDDVDVLAVDGRAAMWGVANILDYPHPHRNDEAADEAHRLFKWPGELYGPVLIVETF